MSIAFIHVSDIHFGQNKGGLFFVHNDVRERLIDDVRAEVKKLPSKRASGVIVSGDIAFGGKAEEYKAATAWLSEVAITAGCAITDVQVVPGNHDIDRGEISKTVSRMLEEIVREGEGKLDEFLEAEGDCALLYRRFKAYEPFANGYNSPLDPIGGGAGERTVALAPGRNLRFVGLNTALISGKQDGLGTLLLGMRQRVLRVRRGEELVVIAHHPFNWLQDSNDARNFVRARARVLVTGHEHKPSVSMEKVEEGSDILRLAAGATVPPDPGDEYTYTYNIVQFEWDSDTDGLKVTVQARKWDDDNKRFTADDSGLNGYPRIFILACKNFRDGDPVAIPATGTPFEQTIEVPIVQAQGVLEERKEASVPAQFSLLQLRFFRDLSDSQRTAALVELNAIPAELDSPLNQGTELRLLANLQTKNKLAELEALLDKIDAERKKEEEHKNG